MEYGVGITNRYAFLNDDVEDEDVAVAVPAPAPVVAAVVQVQAGKGKKPVVDKKPIAERKPVVDKKPVADNKSSLAKDDEWGDPIIQQQSHRDFGGNSRGRGSGRGGGGFTRQTDYDRNGFDNGGGNGMDKRYGNFDDGGVEHRDFGSSRGRGGGRGSGRGGFTRRRDFDRLSGSDKGGVKPTDKRDGAGAHNWGTFKDGMTYNDESESRFDDAVKDDFAENGQGDAELNGNETNGELDSDETQVLATEPKVEEPKLLTLEQWKAMQEPKSTPNFNIRKPNEGEDPSKWKNLVLKKKENLEDDEDDLIYEEEDIYAPQRAGRLKRITDIGFHFVDDPERDEQRTFRRGGSMGPKPMRERATDGGGDSYSGGYGGFGRGGTRGTSRGGYRRERPSQDQGQRGRSQDVPRVDDTKEWPSLVC